MGLSVSVALTTPPIPPTQEAGPTALSRVGMTPAVPEGPRRSGQTVRVEKQMQNKFTRFLTAGLLAGSVMFTGCADDGEIEEKASIDEAALASGIMVTIVDNQGSVIVPFTEPLPDAPLDEITQALAGTVGLTVQSGAGTTATLNADGELVQTAPSKAGQYMWELADDRASVRLIFFNQTAGGLSLTAGGAYTALIQVVDNDFVENADIQVAAVVSGS